MTNSSKPTDAELSLLRVLWARGPSTVREIHDTLGTGSAYTTTLKVLQIMHGKELVNRDAAQRSHVYEAAISEADAEGTLIGDLLHKAFSGSAARLAMRALSLEKSSPEELAELRRMIEEREGERS